MPEQLAEGWVSVLYESLPANRLAEAWVQALHEATPASHKLRYGSFQVMYEVAEFVAEAAVDALAGKPEQYYIIHDSLAAGSSVIASAGSEYGPRIGPVRPNSTNHGSMIPSMIGTPVDSTDSDVNIQIVKGGGIGTAEWAYQGEDDTWYGANGREFTWGHHAVRPDGNSAGVMAYSAAFGRVVVLTSDPSTGRVNIRYANQDDRPSGDSGYLPPDSGDSYFEPINGVSDDTQGLALIELRDGTLMAVVRGQQLSTATNVVQQGDYDLYRSIDGGFTWDLAFEGMIQSVLSGLTLRGGTMVRLATSGDWLRFCFFDSGNDVRTLVSADGGATWKLLTTAITVDGVKYNRNDHDEIPFDLVGLDDRSGTFMMAAEGGGNTIDFWYATRDDEWTSVTLIDPIFDSDTIRAMAFVRGPYYLQLWICQFTNNDSEDSWSMVEAPRESALSSDTWSKRDNMFRMRAACRLHPIQMTGAWLGDRGGIMCYVEDGETTEDYHVNQPFMFYVGGWSGKPIGVRTGSNDNLFENLRWDYLQGAPAGGGAVASTYSEWVSALSAAGTFAWTGDGIEMASTTTGDNLNFSWTVAPGGADTPAEWDPNFAAEKRALKNERWISEWVVSVGATAPTSNIEVQFGMPSKQTANEGWDLRVFHTTDSVILYDEIGATPLATISGLNLAGSYEEKRPFRVRMAVSPATTNPSFLIQVREEGGGDWQEAGPVSLGSQAYLATDMSFVFGQPSTNTDEINSRWREFRIASRNLKTNYAHPDGYNTPGDYAGAHASLNARGLGAGSTTNTPNGLRVAWTGGAAVVNDSFDWSLDHSHAAEHMFLDSPRYPWVSAAGATAGTNIVLAATGQDTTDTGARWVHDAAAFFETGGAQFLQVEYANDTGFSVGLTSTSIDLTQFSGIRVDSAAGRMVRWLDAGTAVREGELNGRYLKVTAEESGSGRLNHVHKISRHRYDGTYHYAELSSEGQFDPDLIVTGDTFSVISNKAMIRYPATAVRRYMRVTFGQSGQNSWDGRWKLGRLILGIARKFDPPLAWKHSDTQTPDTNLLRTRGGVTWAYAEAPPERRIVGRWIGDHEGEREAFRDNLNFLAGYQEQPIALSLDVAHTLGEEEHLVLTRFDGSVGLDQQAWKEDENGFRRPVGDMQVFFKEIV